MLGLTDLVFFGHRGIPSRSNTILVQLDQELICFSVLSAIRPKDVRAHACLPPSEQRM